MSTLAKPATARTYTPTADELNAEIKTYLKKRPDAEYREVRARLLQQKKDWIMPERRMAKFVKRQKAGTPITAEDEESVVNSVGGLRRLFSGKGTAASTASSKSNKTTKSNGSALDGAKAKVPAKVKEPELLPPTPAAAKEEVAKSKALALDEAAEDAGKKEVHVCEGCILL